MWKEQPAVVVGIPVPGLDSMPSLPGAALGPWLMAVLSLSYCTIARTKRRMFGHRSQVTGTQQVTGVSDCAVAPMRTGQVR